MKHILKLFITLFFSILLLKSVSQKNTADSLVGKISLLNQEIGDIRHRMDLQDAQINTEGNVLNTSFAGVSSQISTVAAVITFFGIAIAFGTLIFGAYVSDIYKKVKVLNQESESLLFRNMQIKEEMELLSKKITNDSKGIYKIIRDEETSHVINRLLQVPEDINNVSSILFSRDLNKNHYYKIKEAFLQVRDDFHHSSVYLNIIFQHFADLAIADTEISMQFQITLFSSMNSAFKKDMVKSTVDYFGVIVHKGIEESESEINSFVKALNGSLHANLEIIYSRIFEVVFLRDARFLLYNVVEKSEETRLFRRNYGKFLLNYKLENATVQENLILNEIEKL